MTRFFINLDYKMSTRIYYVCIKYTICDLIFDVITCCVWSCDMGKINASDKNWRASLLIGSWDSTAIGTNSPCDESPAYTPIIGHLVRCRQLGCSACLARRSFQVRIRNSARHRPILYERPASVPPNQCHVVNVVIIIFYPRQICSRGSFKIKIIRNWV